MPRLKSKLCTLPKKLFFQFTLQRDSPNWFINDTCGKICAFITWMLIIYGNFVMFYVLLPPWYNFDNNNMNNFESANRNLRNIDMSDFRNQDNIQNMNRLKFRQKSDARSVISSSQSFFNSKISATINGLIFLTMSVFAFVSHVRAMFSDPGSTELNNASPESIQKMNLPAGHVLYKCTKCVAIKPDRAHHCSVCRRCIVKMDHHCPWINNCVGEKNQKYFVLFTLYICLISLQALIIVIKTFINCANTGWSSNLCTIRSSGVTLINMIGLTFEAALFCLFTAIMFGTQIYAICVDETGIEQLKGDYKHKNCSSKKNSKCLNFKSVFGDKLTIRWLVPFFSPRWAKQDVSLYAV